MYMYIFNIGFKFLVNMVFDMYLLERLLIVSLVLRWGDKSRFLRIVIIFIVFVFLENSDIRIIL